jgi:hypothetical protein
MDFCTDCSIGYQDAEHHPRVLTSPATKHAASVALGATPGWVPHEA